jgi:hypothetical protein
MIFIVVRVDHNNIMKKIIKKIIWSSLLFVPNLAMAAMENIYPPIPVSFNKTLIIDAASSPADYVIYFYAFFLSISTVIAVVVMIWAGVEMIMSSGNPSKISSAKNKGVGALIGVGVILGSYIILNTISSTLSNPVVDSLNCEKSNVCINYVDVSGKITSATSISDSSDLGLKSGDKIIIKRYSGLKEVWGFSDVDYKGSAQRIGGYHNEDTINLENELPMELTIDSSIKSIKIYSKQLGAYLYDASGFGVNSLAPLFAGKSLEDLGEYKNKIKSIQFLNDADSKYYAVTFALPKYNHSYDYNFYPQAPRPSCSEVIKENANISSLIGSILLFKSKTSFLAEPASGIFFYDILSCDNSNPAYACLAPTGTLFEKQTIDCSGFEPGDVLSVRVTKQAGVLMFSDDNNYCSFFDISDPNRVSGDCISNDILFSKKIVNKFIIIPYENKL